MRNDAIIKELLDAGRLCVDRATGQVFAPRSNTPQKPVGAITRKGYLRTCVNYAGKRFYLLVHRVVWIDSHGTPSSDEIQVNYMDTIKTHNWPDNLELATNDENMAHAKKHRLHVGCGRRDGIRDSKGRFRVKAAGASLDGREWHEFPAVAR